MALSWLGRQNAGNSELPLILKVTHSPCLLNVDVKYFSVLVRRVSCDAHLEYPVLES